MPKKKKVLFICTGNACRSQIAHGLLKDLSSETFEVFSAGSHPGKVHPISIAVMKEIGIDISSHTSDPISHFLSENINIVITVCDNADKVCPVFPGKVERIHWNIDDPFKRWVSDSHDLVNFRKTREDLSRRINDLLSIRFV